MKFLKQLKKTNKKASKAIDTTVVSISEIEKKLKIVGSFAMVSMAVAIGTNILNMVVGINILKHLKK